MILNKITLVIFSASRPKLFEKTCRSLIKNIDPDLFRSNFIISKVHEDVINKWQSEQSTFLAIGVAGDPVAWIQTEERDDGITISDPPAGVVGSVGVMLPLIKTKYMIRWEEDVEAIHRIPIKEIYQIMEENEDVNQIVLPRRPIRLNFRGWQRKVVEKSGYKLTVSERWKAGPAMWRMSYIRPRYKYHENWEHWYKYILGNKERDADWCMKNLGSYFFGGEDNDIYIKHIGHGQSARLGEIS